MWIQSYEMCLKKSQDWCHRLIPDNKQHDFPFRVIPLESHALFHPLPCSCALLEGFFWDVPQLRRSGLLDYLHAFTSTKRVSHQPLEENENKLRRARAGKVVSPLRLCSSRPELPDAHGGVHRCIVVVKQP